MRYYGESAEVEAVPTIDGGFEPRWVTWRGRRAVVAEVLQYWCEARQWWKDPHAPDRDVWYWRVRLVADGSLIVDLKEDDQRWTVEYLVD